MLAVAHECDLALLTVEDEQFWTGGRGLQALAFGQVPVKTKNPQHVTKYTSQEFFCCAVSVFLKRVNTNA